MSEKTVVVALGHKALGTTLPEQSSLAIPSLFFYN